MTSDETQPRDRRGLALEGKTWPTLVRAVDLAILFLASQLALHTRFDDAGEFSSYGPYIIVAGLLLAFNAFRLFGLYRPHALFAFTTLFHLVVVWALVFLVFITIGYATGTANEISRIWVALWFVYGSIGLSLSRIGYLCANGWSVAAPGQAHTVALIGDRASIDQFIGRLGNAPDGSSAVAAVFVDEPVAAKGNGRDGAIDKLIAYCRSHRVDEVVIASDGSRLIPLINRLADLPVDVAICPNFGVGTLTLRGIRDLGSMQVIRVAERPLGGHRALIKRVEDILISVLVLALIAPLLPLIALAVKLDSPGPVFFRQTRYGFNDELIEVLKFRTMHVDQSPDADRHLRQASRNDKRVTRVGRWLRRTSMDELPQFLDVLAGRMSVVGPRPHAVAHHREYADLIPFYDSRHRVKPGITGWAQVNGWRGETDTLAKMTGRVFLDLYYISNWSLLFDLKIVLMTIFGGMMNKNAY